MTNEQYIKPKYQRVVKHPLSPVYSSMRDRCYNPKSTPYRNYGGRGITVCQEWLDDKLKFYEWALANGWEKGLEIDRIDNDGPYSPENCRVLTHKENCRNRATNRVYIAFGVEATLMELVETFCPEMYYQTIRDRIKRGWEVEKALSSPSSRPARSKPN